MDHKLRGIAVYRTIFFMPSICMFVASRVARSRRAVGMTGLPPLLTDAAAR